ncbi:MAG: hypothetical protein MUD01_11600 [Chloroflexaceae bacterium]|jgi:hypothetical protein|nr:hypothetical protein [Chloroflexaceae bacterium]
MRRYPRPLLVLALVLAIMLASLAVPAARPALAEPVTPAQVQTPDATAPGPFPITTAEYRFPATVDPDILADRFTEIWARVWRPQPLPAGPSPLIVMLHGNSLTCTTPGTMSVENARAYSLTGQCPPGFTVVLSHEGYGYLAERLASWGYIIVSINANRGINMGPRNSVDFSLIFARGRLVLKHLQLWSQWSRVGGAPDSLGLGSNGFVGKVDVGNVGLLGHSRGGEGVRAAYNLYRDAGSPWPARIPGLQVKAIFEIAPTDGYARFRGNDGNVYPRFFNAEDTAWTALLPMCDGDILGLDGLKPFDRMLLLNQERQPAQKATYLVWGANHNFYNTVWQERNDSAGCLNHTPLTPEVQRSTALESVLALFRGNVGVNAPQVFNRTFNPLAPLPPPPPPFATRPARVERGFAIATSD